MKKKKPKPENNNNDDNPTRIQKTKNKKSKRLTSDILLLYVNKLQRALEGLVAQVEVTTTTNTTTIRMMSGFAGVRERTCRLHGGHGSHGSKRVPGKWPRGRGKRQKGDPKPKGKGKGEGGKNLIAPAFLKTPIERILKGILIHGRGTRDLPVMSQDGNRG